MGRSLWLTTLSAMLMVFSGLPSAQDHPLIIRSREKARRSKSVYAAPGPPKYCSPCLFYGGDWPNHDPNWIAVDDWDLPIYGQAALYTPFNVPTGKTWTVTSIFANVAFININKMDPPKPEWSINSGMSPGNGGKVIVSEKSIGTATPTGRKAKTFAGEMVEYTISVKLPKPVKLAGGKMYWESVVPPCTNGNDPACRQIIYYYETDTYDDTHLKQGAHAFGPVQPLGLALDNYPYIKAYFFPIDPGFCKLNSYQAYACYFWSAGVIGTEK